MSGNMSIRQKYILIFGTVTERDFRKKSKAQKHIQMEQRCALDFSQKTRSVTVPRFGFFRDSRIRVKVNFRSYRVRLGNITSFANSQKHKIPS